MFTRSLLTRRKVTLIGQDSFVISALATHLKAHAIMTSIQLPQYFSSLKKDLHNIPSHCALDYIPRNNPLKDQNAVVLCPKDEKDTVEWAKWYAGVSTDEYEMPPLFILCENVNFATVLASMAVKHHIPTNCASIVPRSIMGLPTFAVYRARGFLSSACNRNPYDIDLTLAIGGTPSTSVPLTAAMGHHFGVPDYRLHDITKRSQNYPMETIIEEKSILHPEETMYSAFSQHSPNTVAFAGFEFIVSFLRAQRGDGPATEVVFTEQFEPTDDAFFDKENESPKFLARRAVIDQPGLVKLEGYGKLSEFEQKAMRACLPALRNEIATAKDAFKKLSA